MPKAAAATGTHSRQRSPVIGGPKDFKLLFQSTQPAA